MSAANTRRLSLRREELTELNVTELGGVAGAAAASGATCPLTDCVAAVSRAISCTPTCGYTGCCPTAVC